VTPPTRYDEIARALDFDPTELMTLRQASRHDPPRNCPMLVAGEEVQPGAWREFHADPITDLPVNCPVTPLGKDASTYYFLDTLGAVLTIKAASSGKGEIDSLFAGRSRFLEWAWPRWQAARSAKDPPRVKGFEATRPAGTCSRVRLQGRFRAGRQGSRARSLARRRRVPGLSRRECRLDRRQPGARPARSAGISTRPPAAGAADAAI
jgi:hypothetical protein